MYDVRLPNSRAKGAGYAERQRRWWVKIMQGGWFERSADFAELCHRLGKSYIVLRTSYIANAPRLPRGLF